MMKTWGCFAVWVDAAGQVAVDALRKLEALKVPFGVDQLRCLRLLRTPESRLALANYIQTGVRTLKDVDDEAQRQSKAMWCSWQWCDDNTFIADDKRVCLPVFCFAHFSSQAAVL